MAKQVFILCTGISGSVSFIKAFENGILLLNPGRRSDTEKREICELYFETLNANIRSFMKTKTTTLTVHLESIDMDFRKFWDLIDAEGDLEAAQLFYKSL